jgi:dTDP-4-dehydrorhamnose 3,5-epimerase
MDATKLSLDGLLLLKPKVFKDDRGFFVETYQESRYRDAGVDVTFVQDNHSRSTYGTIRGLHFQTTPGQAKLLRVATGRIFDVAVDIRPGSKTFGKWEGVYLDADLHHQLYVPVGFAHGFCVVSETADVLYKVSSPYDPKTETGFHYADPAVGVAWPVEKPVLSKRDAEAKPLAQVVAPR